MEGFHVEIKEGWTGDFPAVLKKQMWGYEMVSPSLAKRDDEGRGERRME